MASLSRGFKTTHGQVQHWETIWISDAPLHTPDGPSLAARLPRLLIPPSVWEGVPITSAPGLPPCWSGLPDDVHSINTGVFRVSPVLQLDSAFLHSSWISWAKGKA